ncbi:MAG: hypothetical protein JXA57_20560, partial [Armatimonadetes bacterium]|nr:hypothetical protein [Armatimonadota bacterium]
MDKKDLTEQEIRTRYITPAIRQAKWQAPQIREEVYITDGQIHPDGKAPRGKCAFADCVLHHQAIPLAIVEAKDNTHPVGCGSSCAASSFSVRTRWPEAADWPICGRRTVSDSRRSGRPHGCDRSWTCFS